MAQFYFNEVSNSNYVFFHNGQDNTASSGVVVGANVLETPGIWNSHFELPKSPAVTPDNQMVYSKLAAERKIYDLNWPAAAPITKTLANTLQAFYEGTVHGPRKSFVWQDQYGSQRTVHWISEFNFTETPGNLFTGSIRLFQEISSTATEASGWTAEKVPRSNLFFEIKSWTGDDTNPHEITTAIQPLMVWVKERDGTNSWQVSNDVRGATKYMEFYAAGAEATDAQRVAELNATTPSFSLGTSTTTNDGDNEYLAAVFYGNGGQDAGEFTRSGFHMFATTGSTGDKTFNHALLKAPTFMIGKKTSGVGSWYVYHKSIGATQNLVIDTDASTAVATATWNDYVPTATDFQTGGTPVWDGGTYLFMCWTDQPGYFKTGFYSASDPTAAQNIDVGFRPSMLLIKSHSATGEWHFFTDVRGDNGFLTSEQVVESEDPYQLRIHNSGFYLLAGADGVNITGVSYVYCAWQGSG